MDLAIVVVLHETGMKHLILVHTYTHTRNCFMALWILAGTTGVSRYQKKHSPTHTNLDHQSSLICFLHLLRSTASSQFNLCASQSFFTALSKFSLAWHPPLHTPYISSPNHCLLFASHAHTIATSFAVVPRLCHIILLSSLNPLLGTLSCSLMPHTHLTILVCARRSASSLRFLQARTHFHATYYFAHNCCKISLSQTIIYPCITSATSPDKPMALSFRLFQCCSNFIDPNTICRSFS